MIHIFPQHQWHDESFIMGEPQDLLALADAIQRAVAMHGDPSKPPAQKVETYTNDGEGYNIFVVPMSKDEMNNLSLPYRLPGLEKQPGTPPHQFVKRGKNE